MKYEKLVKLCLQQLEQDSETDVMNEDISSLEENDTFQEYLYNIEHSIYMGLVRFATSQILPLKDVEFEKGKSVLYITKNGSKDGKRVFHRIKDVYAEDDNGNVYTNIQRMVVGNKIVLTNMNSELTYHVVYNPTILELDNYIKDNETIYDIDLDELGVPDEMAINIKYLVYSDMKMEENPSVAIQNKNFFETYLAQCATEQITQVQSAYSEYLFDSSYAQDLGASDPLDMESE